MTEGSLYSTSSLRICYFHGSMYIANMYFYFFQTGYEVAEGYWSSSVATLRKSLWLGTGWQRHAPTDGFCWGVVGHPYVRTRTGARRRRWINAPEHPSTSNIITGQSRRRPHSISRFSFIALSLILEIQEIHYTTKHPTKLFRNEKFSNFFRL